MKKQKDKLAEYTAGLERSFKEWEHLYNYGGQDPFWADGMNLNLVRNHILSYKRQIEEYIKDENDGQASLFSNTYPDIYFKETPPEVDNDYMAIPNRILDRAITFVNRMVEEPAYKYVVEHFDEVFPDKKENPVSKHFNVPAILAWQLTSYPEKIVSGDLIALRRSFYFTDYDKKLEEVNKIADKMKQVLALSNEEREAIMNKKRGKSVSDDEYEYDDYEVQEDEEIADTEPEKDTSKTSSNPSLDDIIGNAEQKKAQMNENKGKDNSKDSVERI